ncbi:MAG: pyridoxal-phosphate dependent enzyme [Chloroflexota bacterium]
MEVKCLNCGRPYPETGAPYRCPACGGLYDFAAPPTFGALDQSQPGIWRYASSFGFPFGSAQGEVAPVSLGEGNTPLVSAKVFKREVFFKCEYENPSGSFKDRGTATLVAFLKSRRVTEAVEDSSGNAGASFAAYAAQAGIRARVFVPESASGPKRKQIEEYGAELIPVPGPRSNAAEAVRRAADAGAVYASHAYLPFNLPGYATVAYEIVEQLGRAPGAVIVPAGQGGLLLGAWRGFLALKQAGVTRDAPRMIGVQAAACAPLFALSQMGPQGLQWVTEAPTLAEGVRVRSPLRAEAVLQAVESSGGKFIAVDEAFILPGRDELKRRGLYVETTSALVWRALEETLKTLPDPVVAILTGAGYKFQG